MRFRFVADWSRSLQLGLWSASAVNSVIWSWRVLKSRRHRCQRLTEESAGAAMRRNLTFTGFATAADASGSATVNSPVITRFTSEKVGRLVGNGTRDIRISPLFSGEASSYRTVSFPPGAAMKMRDADSKCAFQACKVPRMSCLKPA